MIAIVESNENKTSKELMMAAKEMEKRYKTVEEEMDNQLEEAWDDVSGGRFGPQGSEIGEG